jgi:hypothetical protein
MRFALPAAASLALASSLMSLPAFAGPADYVYTPNVEYGERELELKYGTAKLRDGSRASEISTSFGLGVTEHWFTELYAKWHKEPFDHTTFDAWEWENKFQLTEQGRYPVDIGFLLEIERPRDRSEGYEVRWGPLFETDITDRVQANFNAFITKHYRATEAGPAELGYQWQLKYRYKPEFEFGVQGFGEVGPWTHWEHGSAQSHIAGPAVFGKFNLGERRVIKYDAAILFGMTQGAPRNTFRLRTEYEF